MNNKLKQIEMLERHIEKHPHDYQSVISLYKLRSDQSAYEIRKRQQESQKVLAQIRRICNEECTQ